MAGAELRPLTSTLDRMRGVASPAEANVLDALLTRAGLMEPDGTIRRDDFERTAVQLAEIGDYLQDEFDVLVSDPLIQAYAQICDSNRLPMNLAQLLTSMAEKWIEWDRLIGEMQEAGVYGPGGEAMDVEVNSGG